MTVNTTDIDKSPSGLRQPEGQLWRPCLRLAGFLAAGTQIINGDTNAVLVPTFGAGSMRIRVLVDGTVTVGVRPRLGDRLNAGLSQGGVMYPRDGVSGTSVELVMDVPLHGDEYVLVQLANTSGSTRTVSYVDVYFSPDARFTFTQSAKLRTYRAFYRLAARPYALSAVFGAAGRTQFATIWHGTPTPSFRLVKLRKALVAVESASAAGIIMADLVRITTAPATGNPAITPAVTDARDPAAEAACLALPTTPGTEGALLASTEFNLGITGAASVGNPPPDLAWRDLLAIAGIEPDNEVGLPSIRTGSGEGYAIVMDAGAALTLKAYAMLEFTEQYGPAAAGID